MVKTEHKLRVRFGETDKMTYSYYGNYAMYYEVGRTEMMRELGFTYRKLEESGVMLPVMELYSHFIKPSKYDDLLTIKTRIEKKPGIRVRFDYEIYNEANELINDGWTVLVFTDMTGKPIRPPQYFMKVFEPYFD